MKVAALSLLLLLDSLDSGSAPVSLSVSPKRSQFFKYDSFSVSCEGEEQSEEEVAGWRVMKRTEDGEVRPCPSSCSITAAFPATDSGVYWCETGRGETSNSVNISVTAGSVILDSPVLPVMEGHDVTLSCRPRVTMSSFHLTADFYKDGVFIRSSSTGNMTIHSVSPSDEGLYRCNVSGAAGAGGSADSWLTVRAPPAGRDPPPPLLSVSALLRHLVVGAPYLLSTILLGLIYRDRARVQHARKSRQTSDDVIMEMAA
ncbi:Fc receptor-like B isoform X5 [Epinephelus fuscoguttatus]|uniref:Fc receptor-like B isoform X5 n=1 Tax=Epinephelus fuscoguttatus TaxID=293821 RepID=UPI0020D0D484|nr:Fc receptor-like B isoform X5 [Epinephelus fuscoguttatus]